MTKVTYNLKDRASMLVVYADMPKIKVVHRTLAQGNYFFLSNIQLGEIILTSFVMVVLTLSQVTQRSYVILRFVYSPR